MGYAHYVLPDGREAGYGVSAPCDGGCGKVIDRGLGYLCGELPEGHRDPDEAGCGRYYCGECMGSHDCANPACGQWSADGNCRCSLSREHVLVVDAPHRDRDGTTFTETEAS